MGQSYFGVLRVAANHSYTLHTCIFLLSPFSLLHSGAQRLPLAVLTAPVYIGKMQIGLSFAAFFDFVLPRDQGLDCPDAATSATR
ncbi:hypothetical protein BH10PLA2_BH10PLA2_16880 [soil metagenome]